VFLRQAKPRLRPLAVETVESDRSFIRRYMLAGLAFSIIQSSISFWTSSVVGADDSTWSASLNSNAETGVPNTLTLGLQFPAAGPMNGTMTTPTPAAIDGFCSRALARAYSTERCRVEDEAHRGQDFAPIVPSALAGTGSWASHGTVPVLAAASGQVTEASCINGNGFTVTIRDSSNHYFRALHLSSTPLVSSGSYVSAGQRIGFVGGTKSSPCSTIDYGTPHLHFEIRWPDMNSYTGPMDPWVSLRAAYARPGLWASGTVDIGMRDAWIYFATLYGLSEVGYSVSQGPTWIENVQWIATNSGTSGLAAVQFLTSGLANYSADRRSGALVRRSGASTAFLVRGSWWKRWLTLGLQNSFLGWPISFDDSVRQDFQGGCIVVSGATVVSQPNGVAPCV